MHSRWLHRTAGTVGLAGGFLLLGAGAAQADQAEEAQLLDGLLSEVFSPTSGLPPLDLSTDTDPVLDGLPTGGVPLDQLGLPGGTVGGLPTDGLLQLDGATVGLPTRSVPARTLPAPAPAPAPAAHAEQAEQAGQAEQAEQAELVGPALLAPITDGLLGGASLGNMLPAGSLVGQVPVAGPMVAQTAHGLPLVNGLVPVNGPNGPGGQPAPIGPAPAGTEEVPAVIAQDLAAEGGYSPELLDDRAEIVPGLPLVGPALEPVSKMVGVGDIGSQLPVVGPLVGPLLGNLPVVDDPAAAAAPVPLPASAQAPAMRPVAAGETEERPYAGDDPEYPAYYSAEERAEVLPLGGLSQALPLDLLRVPLAMLGGGGLPLPI